MTYADESQHSGAESYRRLMAYFQPDFWLGMTATPETNRFDVYEIFDHNIAYEICLKQALDEELKFYEYHSGEELVWELESMPQILDMLILDMQFGKGKMDGDAAAAKFRELFPDAVLVFCSGVCLPTVRSFYATPFRYLMKSQPNAEIIRVLREALAETGRRQEEKFLVGHYRGASFRIRHRDILYIERAKRGGNIRVRPDSPAADKAEKLLTDQKLEDLAEELKDDGFAMPQNSFLLNLYHIEVLYGNELQLDNGERISISKSFKPVFTDAVTRFTCNKYDDTRDKKV